MSSIRSETAGQAISSARSGAGATAGGRVIEERELREFGLVLGGLFAAIFGVALPLLHHGPSRLWPWALAVVLVSAALIRPAVLRYLYEGWSRVGAILGWINTRIILTVLFYVIVTPMGIVARALGFLSLDGLDPSGKRSYRVGSNQINRSGFEKPF